MRGVAEAPAADPRSCSSCSSIAESRRPPRSSTAIFILPTAASRVNLLHCTWVSPWPTLTITRISVGCPSSRNDSIKWSAYRLVNWRRDPITIVAGAPGQAQSLTFSSHTGRGGPRSARTSPEGGRAQMLNPQQRVPSGVSIAPLTNVLSLAADSTLRLRLMPRRPHCRPCDTECEGIGTHHRSVRRVRYGGNAYLAAPGPKDATQLLGSGEQTKNSNDISFIDEASMHSVVRSVPVGKRPRG